MPVTPDYTKEFLLCVADEYKAREYGDCTDRAITDWSIIIDDQ